MAIYFSSDHHFYHHNIIKYCNRPFKDVDHMNEVLIANWNNTVQPEDIVYYLGDFSMNWKQARPLVSRLNGTKHLIPGNHDSCHPVHKDSKRQGQAVMAYDYLTAGFKSVAIEDMISISVVGQVLLSHMPYMGAEVEHIRYPEWRPMDTGLWLLHGHTHGLWKVKGRMIDVGVDANDYKPVSIEAITKLILDNIP